MFVRYRNKINNFQTYGENLVNKQRLIFLERLIENEQTRDLSLCIDRNIISPHKRYVVILNYCRKFQNNPDNKLIEEEIHTFNTYYGSLYLNPNNQLNIEQIKNLRARDLSLDSVIFIDDYNFNIIYNQLNINTNYFENYNRYQNNTNHSPMYRTTVDSICESMDCPHPKYYTMEEQKHAEHFEESMRELLIKNYKNSVHTPLLSIPLRELKDDNTKIGELTIVLNNLTIIRDSESRDKLKQDIYHLISSIKYDMEFCGISKIVGLITSDKGFNFYQMNTVIQMSPQLTQTCVSMFLENFQNRYEEIFQAMVIHLLDGNKLSIYFSLEPIQNIVEISLEERSKNKLELLQQDIHDQLVNTIF